MAAYQPIVPLPDAKLDVFLKYISNGTLTLSAVQHALSLPSGPMNVLKTLIPLFTSKIPWGSIAYHYSTTPLNSLSPSDVFDKLVTRGLGGHCLEMVPLFASVLRALGYELYMTGARISAALGGDGTEVGFHGWSHIVLIVTLSGQKYVVDPQYIDIVEPILLDPNGEEVIFSGVPSTVMRLRYVALSDIIPYQASRSGLKTWLFEFKHSANEERWCPAYIFSTETEWFLEDLPVVNVWLAKAADSYLLTQFIVKRVLLAGADDPTDGKGMMGVSGSADDGLLVVPEISGSVELANDQLKVWREGKKVVDEKIGTERERIEILKTWFGVMLTEEEAAAILSRPTALRH